MAIGKGVVGHCTSGHSLNAPLPPMAPPMVNSHFLGGMRQRHSWSTGSWFRWKRLADARRLLVITCDVRPRQQVSVGRPGVRVQHVVQVQLQLFQLKTSAAHVA